MAGEGQLACTHCRSSEPPHPPVVQPATACPAACHRGSEECPATPPTRSMAPQAVVSKKIAPPYSLKSESALLRQHSSDLVIFCRVDLWTDTFIVWVQYSLRPFLLAFLCRLQRERSMSSERAGWDGLDLSLEQETPIASDLDQPEGPQGADTANASCGRNSEREAAKTPT